MTELHSISNQEINPAYKNLLGKISATYIYGQVKATQLVNTQMLDTYWETCLPGRQVGQHIVEFEQCGNVRAKYGIGLISTFAKDLSLLHGKGFSKSNFVYMRLLYLLYPISQKPSHQLNWSHFVELLKIEDDLVPAR